ncbi:type I restriction endonuclease subunit R [Acinetobacter sp. YH12069]|uniref:type I restriction endonuclease subunit R n=1 Tax=Acinetobacter sp. YH12069 TaxID=2601065 RepID=UPI0015D4169F|nr:type I restriction endonuclease subunit R [Acinetobacter sp. YH12069]
MSTQKELELENQFIEHLTTLGYERVQYRNETALLANLKNQIEKFNALTAPLTHEQWEQVWNYLSSEHTIFGKAKLLRGSYQLKHDDGTTQTLRFLSDDATKNIFQVTNQVTVQYGDDGTETSRFDVTLLINGFPLVQVELKRSGVEIAQAFHQVHNYSKDAYTSGQGLFGYIQLFVISNSVNCLYYSHGTPLFDFTFPWADENNKAINDLSKFTEAFLNAAHITKMISKYIVQHQTNECLMVLRPYQVYAVENMIQHVKTSTDHAYIWHTTGSGKTLTAFKASEIMRQLPEIEKVIFVVDRKDLDNQTTKEFNAFVPDCVDQTTNTKTLVEQLIGKRLNSRKNESNILTDKLVVTTIQKLNNAITLPKFRELIADLADKKVVFIFDECHRSQFGDTHQNIKRFFKQAQMFGFTGTPIFPVNCQSIGGVKYTTEYLFPKRLHKYVIVDAIADKNVLPFQIDYVGQFTAHQVNAGDEKIQGIDTKELYDNPERLEKIVRYILKNHDKKTAKREFCSMFCVSSVDVLLQYYAIFAKVQAELVAEADKKEEIYTPLVIGTIFSFGAQDTTNDANDSATGTISEEELEQPSQVDMGRKAQLERIIAEFNTRHLTSYNCDEGFYEYYKNLGDRVKYFKVPKPPKEVGELKGPPIDLLLVVNMFLTGFDSLPLNTIYVDKNLKYHGLIQAFSRTNRIYKPTKAFGNVVCFRNLKQATDKALSTFADDQNFEQVIVPPLDQQLAEFNKCVSELRKITPECQSVDDLKLESQQLQFIQAFRDVIRLHSQLKMYTDFDVDNAVIVPQELEDYKSKYKDLYDRINKGTAVEKDSVLRDVNFALDFIISDYVNQDYIYTLLNMIAAAPPSSIQRAKQQQQLQSLLSNDRKMYKKMDLIQKFIDEQIPRMLNGQSVQDAFKQFWDAEKQQAYDVFCKDENLVMDEFKKVVKRFDFTERFPHAHEIRPLPKNKPSALVSKVYFEGLHQKTNAILEKYDLRI